MLNEVVIYYVIKLKMSELIVFRLGIMQLVIPMLKGRGIFVVVTIFPIFAN
jgi:hypothetical protein